MKRFNRLLTGKPKDIQVYPTTKQGIDSTNIHKFTNRIDYATDSKGVVVNPTQIEEIKVSYLPRYSEFVLLETRNKIDAITPFITLRLDSDASSVKFTKIRLYISFFIHKNADRMSEYIKCIRENIALLLEIHAFVNDVESEEWLMQNTPSVIIHKVEKRPTYQDVFDASEDGYINIYANSDIMFTETIYLLKHIPLDGIAICLGKWEILDEKNIEPNTNPSSQDSWMWFGKNILTNCNYYSGTPGCDNRIAMQFSEKYKIVNCMVDIVSIHVHSTNIRSYPKDPVPPPYKTLYPSIIKFENDLITYFDKQTHFRKKTTIVHVGYIMPELQLAFAQNCEKYIFINRNDTPSNIDEKLVKAYKLYNPELIFCQIQSEGILNETTLSEIYKDRHTCMVNWTGDARVPTPEWFEKYAKYFDLTLFSNRDDVKYLRSRGYISDFLNIGFETRMFNPIGNKNNSVDIVFMGNNYDCFPLSRLRLDMVNSLKKAFGNRFRVWGNGWGEDTTACGPEEESNIYRGCKIAISLSHYDLDRYFSDRMLRIMGCSTFCLAKRYPNIEDDFADKQHLVVWNHIDDLIEKIHYYLENPFERFKIARCGFMHVYKNHTWDVRLRELQYIIDNNPPIISPPMLTHEENTINDYNSQVESPSASASQSKKVKYSNVSNFTGSLKILTGVSK